MSWRTAPLPPGWTSRIVPRILRRDGWRCQYRANDHSPRCLEPATDVDHVIPAYLGGTDDDENLQAMCRRHHRSKTGREGRDAQGYRKRPPDPHPGLVDVDPQFDP